MPLLVGEPTLAERKRTFLDSLRSPSGKTQYKRYLFEASRSKNGALTAVLSAGIEPASAAPQAAVLSVERRELVLSERANDTTVTRSLEPHPRPEEVGERVVMRVLRHPLEEVEIDALGVDVLKRDYEMR